MILTHYTNPQKFLDRTRSFLEEKEAFNNLILGSAFSLTRPNSLQTSEESLIFAIEDKGKVVYAALCVAPRNLILSAQDGYLQRGNSMMIAYLQEKGISIPGVIGEKTICVNFAEQWCENGNWDYRIIADMGIYQLDEVMEIAHPKGDFRLGTIAEEDFVAEWILAFDRELFGEQTPESARRIAKGKLTQELLYFWEVEGEIVSMAAGTRPTDHCMTISSVYTPPKHRKNGYARSCVAQLSQAMLDRGYQFCALFTDLTNPTSNKIYQEVGYYKLGEFVNLNFE